MFKNTYKDSVSEYIKQQNSICLHKTECYSLNLSYTSDVKCAEVYQL